MRKNKKQTHAQTYAFSTAPRCGAKTRKGTPCQSPAVRSKRRCRMHGGTRGIGAKKYNKNALKHGFYTRAAKEQRQEINKLIKNCQKLIQDCLVD